MKQKLFLTLTIALLVVSHTALAQDADKLYDNALFQYNSGNPMEAYNTMKPLVETDKTFFSFLKRKNASHYLLAAQAALLSGKYTDFNRYAKQAYQSNHLLVMKKYNTLLPDFQYYVNTHTVLPRLTIGFGSSLIFLRHKVLKTYPANSNISKVPIRYTNIAFEIDYWFLRNFGIGINYNDNDLVSILYYKKARKYFDYYKFHGDNIYYEIYEHYSTRINTRHRNYQYMLCYRNSFTKATINLKVGLNTIKVGYLYDDSTTQLLYPKMNEGKNINYSVCSEAGIDYILLKNVSLRFSVLYSFPQKVSINDNEWKEAVSDVLMYKQKAFEDVKTVSLVDPSFVSIKFGCNILLFNKIYTKYNKN